MNKDIYELSRLKTKEEIDDIQKIAGQYPKELNFIMRQMLADAAKKHELLLARKKETEEIVAFMLYHKRKDNVTTINDIAVDKEHLRQGIAKEMINSLSGTLQLKCVEGNASNEFYKKIGFKCVGIDPGKNRRLLIWKRFE